MSWALCSFLVEADDQDTALEIVRYIIDESEYYTARPHDFTTPRLGCRILDPEILEDRSAHAKAKRLHLDWRQAWCSAARAVAIDMLSHTGITPGQGYLEAEQVIESLPSIRAVYAYIHTYIQQPLCALLETPPARRGYGEGDNEYNRTMLTRQYGLYLQSFNSHPPFADTELRTSTWLAYDLTNGAPPKGILRMDVHS